MYCLDVSAGRLSGDSSEGDFEVSNVSTRPLFMTH